MPRPGWSASRDRRRQSAQPDVLVIHRQIVDAAVSGRDPGSDLARRGDLLHEAAHERLVRGAWQPPGQKAVVPLLIEHFALRFHRLVRPGTDAAPEAVVRKEQSKVVAGALNLHIPAL